MPERFGVMKALLQSAAVNEGGVLALHSLGGLLNVFRGIGRKVRLHQFKGLVLTGLLLLSYLGDQRGVLTADDHDAVLVAHQNIAGEHDLSAAGDGDVDLTGAVLPRALGRDALGVDGHGELLNPVQIPQTAVRDDPGQALAVGEAQHDLTGQRAVAAAATIDHDDVSGLGHIQRLMEEKVVAKGNLHREGDAQQRPRLVGVQKPDVVVHTVEPVHLVIDVAGGQAAERLDQLGSGTLKLGVDPVSDDTHIDHIPFFIFNGLCSSTVPILAQTGSKTQLPEPVCAKKGERGKKIAYFFCLGGAK